MQVALDTNYWNPVAHLFVWASILAWPVVTGFTSGVVLLYISGLVPTYGVTQEVFVAGGFWFYWIVTTVVTIFPVITYYVLTKELRPTLLDDVSLVQKTPWSIKKLFTRKSDDVPEPAEPEKPAEPTELGSRDEITPEPADSASLLHRHRPLSVRSSYAFSHEPGFADLIMSGRWMGAREEQVKRERLQRSMTWVCEEPHSQRPPKLKDIPRDQSAPDESVARKSSQLIKCVGFIHYLCLTFSS